MQVLLIKLSSMGDLIHAFPALTDAQTAIPGIRFDWVVDESFAELAQWHPAVNQIITTAHRRWGRQIGKLLCSGELSGFIQKLRAKRYDLVIDGQTNVRSAVITRLARGLRCGFDRRSVREFGADWVYQKKVFVPKAQHAVNRLRSLFSQVLNYPYRETEPDFAIDLARLSRPDLVLPKQYLIFVHNGGRRHKLWPERYWAELLKTVTAAGFTVLLPSGSSEEHERATRLGGIHPRITALPRLRLSEIAYVIAHAKAAVCNDTGLGHLTAAVNVGSVNLYGPTDPGLVGASGKSQVYLRADFPCAPCQKKSCHYKAPSPEWPACFTTIPPQIVWERLQSLL